MQGRAFLLNILYKLEQDAITCIININYYIMLQVKPLIGPECCFILFQFSTCEFKLII